MFTPSIIEKGKPYDESVLEKGDPEEIVVTNGASWKCPVYVKKLPPCRDACPSSEDIRNYLTQIAQSELFKRDPEASFDEAWHIITDKNPLPAVHGRICPHPCEEGCNRNEKDSPVAINNMERFVGDHGLKRGLKLKKLNDEGKGKSVAVVGAGPSGLSAAYQLARRGYAVTVYEAFEKPGGMLRYGIPEYRLPQHVLDAEIKNIEELGVEIKCSTRIGEDVSFEELQEKFDAMYVAIGAHKGVTMNVPGEDSANVFTGASYLNRIKSGAQVEVGKRVVVVGGGDSAVDAARSSLRLINSENDDDEGTTDEQDDRGKVALDSARTTKRVMGGAEVTILYRRTREEMPAIAKDIAEAEEEGINFVFLATPIEFITEGGRCTAVKCQRMQLGEPDSSGRRRPEPIPGDEFTMEVDTVIVGIGQKPELPGGLAALADDWGWVQVNNHKETKLKGVFSGGDALGLGIATKSVGQGREAAESITDFLAGREYRKKPHVRPISAKVLRMDYYPEAPRNLEQELPVEKRVTGFEEIFQTITPEQAQAEAERCMSCGQCFVCDQCRILCPREAIERSLKRPKGEIMFTDYTRCNGCHVCAESCPCGYIEMGFGL